jgi:hypothetical protein
MGEYKVVRKKTRRTTSSFADIHFVEKVASTFSQQNEMLQKSLLCDAFSGATIFTKPLSFHQ